MLPDDSVASLADQTLALKISRLRQTGSDLFVCHRVLGPKVLEGVNFGQSEYTVWEVYNSPEQERKEPYLFVWLQVEIKETIFPNIICALCRDNLDAGSGSSCPSTPRLHQTADAPIGL